MNSVIDIELVMVQALIRPFSYHSTRPSLSPSSKSSTGSWPVFQIDQLLELEWPSNQDHWKRSLELLLATAWVRTYCTLSNSIAQFRLSSTILRPAHDTHVVIGAA
jgi:hypothetical protein